ncbi:MAG: NAD(P)-binding domain-containing protein [Elioraea tepidiphila]
MAKVAFLGLGVMGFPMAGHLAAKGHDLAVWNRTGSKADAWIARHKGRRAATPAEAARGAEFVMTCVGNDDDLRHVTLGDDGAFHGMKPGATFIDNTTASAAVARELGAAVLVLHGDALDSATLEEANIAAADTVIAVTNDDETNIFSSMLSKRRGCQRAVTLVNKTSYEPILPSLGIDAAVSPATITISSILRHVRRGAVAAVYTLREDFGEVLEAEALPGSRLVSAPLGALEIPRGLAVGAIVRQGEVILPDAETRIEPGDRIIAAVTTGALREAEALIAAEAEA